MKFNFNEQQNNNVTPQIPLYDPVYARELFDQQKLNEFLKLTENLKQQPAQVGDGVNGIVSNEIRRSNVAWIMPENCPTELANFFQNVFLEINKKHFEFHITGSEAFQFTVYDQSYAGTYNWHIDTARIDNDVRKLSMSLLLTDPSEYEGGKLLLNNQGNIVVAEERLGGAVFFPSWIPHCVTPVTKGTRKSLVIWAHGPKFK